MKNVDNSNKNGQTNFFSKLIREDTTENTLNFFLVVVTLIGLTLLFIPCLGMIADIWYHHTLTMNMSDMATFIGAVAGVFASAGISNAWASGLRHKYKQENNDHVLDKENELDDNSQTQAQ